MSSNFFQRYERCGSLTVEHVDSDGECDEQRVQLVRMPNGRIAFATEGAAWTVGAGCYSAQGGIEAPAGFATIEEARAYLARVERANVRIN